MRHRESWHRDTSKAEVVPHAFHGLHREPVVPFRVQTVFQARGNALRTSIGPSEMIFPELLEPAFVISSRKNFGSLALDGSDLLEKGRPTGRDTSTSRAAEVAPGLPNGPIYDAAEVYPLARLCHA